MGHDWYFGIGLFARVLGLYASEPLRGLFIFGMYSSILLLRVDLSQFDTMCDYSETIETGTLITEANTRIRAITSCYISARDVAVCQTRSPVPDDADARSAAGMLRRSCLAKEDPDRNAS
jgi:hypothetical protein